jgi:hypothetical protein
MTEPTPGNLIELRVDNLAQLFHTLDPFPFRERDLDREAEEFIVGWARELAADRAIGIVIHFPETDAQTGAARELKEAFRRYFSDHADATQREIKELFRIGRPPWESASRSWSFACCRRTSQVATWLTAHSDVWSRRAFSFSAGSPTGGPSKYSCMTGCRSRANGICTGDLQARPSS